MEVLEPVDVAFGAVLLILVVEACRRTTGLALPWNPGKERGVGGKDLYVTPAGLWVGSDTNRIGGETRRRIALMPVP